MFPSNKYTIVLIDWTNSANEKFWSPDGSWVESRKQAKGFFSQDKASEFMSTIRGNMFQTLHVEML